MAYETKKGRRSGKTAALGGILLALSTVSLFLASFVPGVELSLYALSSFFTGVMVAETRIRGGFLFYIAETMLAFFLIPNKGAALVYACFFGLYALVKYGTEQIKKRWAELTLKLVFFLVSALAMVMLFRELFFGAVHLPDGYPAWLLFAGAAVVFLVFDYVFTLVIAFYYQRIRKQIRRN